jgi:ABC-type glycerol-3-phosphate transport system permease component
MPIIPQVGRKALRIRLLIALIYASLGLGAVTMVYPFLLMLSTSVTSTTDTNEFRVIPRYLFHDDPLFAKYVDEKYAGDIDMVNARYVSDFRRNETVKLPRRARLNASAPLLAEWRAFSASVPMSFREAGFRGYGFNPSYLTEKYLTFARKRFGGDIEKLNHLYIEENEQFLTVLPPMERMNKRNWSPDFSPKMTEFQEWKRSLPSDMLIVAGADLLFGKYLQEDVAAYDGDLAKANRVWRPHAGFSEIALAPTAPTNPAQCAIWEQFVRTRLPFRYLSLPPQATTLYRAFLQRRHGTIARLNQLWETRYHGFGEIHPPVEMPSGGRMSLDWGDFIARAVPLSLLRVDTPENRFRAWLLRRYAGPSADRGDLARAPVAAINRALRLSAASVLDIHPPYYDEDAAYVRSHARALRWDFVARNYRIVMDYIVLHGHALWVTLFFCLGVVLTTLIVNPLCAYALSRYALPYAYKVLLFLLATMAFPAEVAMIPNFLLLKQLSLLNTFWALILPGMASGFSIFLLKGFFDSLPRELYEAGTIDGASDSLMFRQITLPLSKPIFAVIALQAFTGAYGAFMFAFLVCQDQRMWTIMVWLYELQVNNPQYMMMAALTVAALPTLLVFIFAQNVIMRGIILPSFK